VGIIANIRDMIFDRPFNLSDLVAAGRLVIIHDDPVTRITVERVAAGRVRVVVRMVSHTDTAVAFTLSYDAAFNLARQIKTVIQMLAQYDRK